jgi:hypothetical protein
MAEITGLQDAVRELDRAIANVNGGAIALANSGTRRRSCAGVAAAGGFPRCASASARGSRW